MHGVNGVLVWPARRPAFGHSIVKMGSARAMVVLPLLLLARAVLTEDQSCSDALAEAQELAKRLPDAATSGTLLQALTTVGAAHAGLEAQVATLRARVRELEGEFSLASSTMTHSGVVYVGMSADIVHHGHANILRVASELKASRGASQLVVGLLSDEAIAGYKRTPIVSWSERRALIEAFKGVDLVVSQASLDYRPNLRLWRPAFVVHGADWAEPSSKQYATRQQVIDTLAEWGGELVEPNYTAGISTSAIIAEIARRVKEGSLGATDTQLAG